MKIIPPIQNATDFKYHGKSRSYLLGLIFIKHETLAVSISP